MLQPVNGQSTFPTASDSVTWTVCKSHYSPVNAQVWLNTITYDIKEWASICGENYSIVHSDNDIVAYIRNDSSRVYIRATSDCNDNEYLLYDFSLSVGDTFYSVWNLENLNYSYEPDTIPLWVERIDTLDIDTSNYELVFTLNIRSYNFQTWTTGFGSDFNTFYPLELYSYGGACECSYETMCKLNVGQYPPDSCRCSGTMIINVPKVEKTSFQLYPNPTFGKIVVSSSSKNYSNRLSLFNTSGKIVFDNTIRNGQVIDLDNLDSGLYIAIVRTEKGTFEKYKLIKL